MFCNLSVFGLLASHVSITKGSEMQVSLLRMICRQMLAMRRHHESQLMAFESLPRGSRKGGGLFPWRRWSKRCGIQDGA